MVQRIIIDTDPGIDDAIAILFALGSPELDVKALVAVAGNAPLAIVERNARALCELAERPGLPVFSGRDRPLRRPLGDAIAAHGEGGLGALRLPEPGIAAQPQDGVEFLVETARRAPPRTVTWCALGPLTNIAAALTEAPEIAANLANLVIMGGATREPGNMTPAAEFNFYVDPHAAAIVFESGAPIILVPLDVTRQLISTRPRLARLRALCNKAGAAVSALLRPVPPSRRAMTLHDACVIAWLVAPELFRGRRVNVAIETESALTLGMSVTDWRGVTGRPANAFVLERVDAAGFYALLTDRLARLP
ncbi:MAG TPA: nucleoside hydrolase [Stellaceae bacterium]|jgi:purine nucleosidase|nr:nucleoside hydrolase [Stellaceae bacterium]